MAGAECTDFKSTSGILHCVSCPQTELGQGETGIERHGCLQNSESERKQLATTGLIDSNPSPKKSLLAKNS